MNKKNIVSVIVPSYNRKNTLTRALNSIKRQTYRPIEVIIIDDCSTDRTEELLGDYDFKDLRKIIIKNQINKGIGESRNIGIRNANGHFLTFLDSDDAWININKIQKQVDFLEKNKDYDFVGTSCRVSINHPMKTELQGVKNDTDCRNISLSYFFIHIDTWMLRKSLIKKIGYFWKFRCEDYEYLLRIGRKTKYGLLNITTAHYYNETKGDHTLKVIYTGITRFLIILKYSFYYPFFLRHLFSRILRIIKRFMDIKF